MRPAGSAGQAVPDLVPWPGRQELPDEVPNHQRPAEKEPSARTCTEGWGDTQTCMGQREGLHIVALHCRAEAGKCILAALQSAVMDGLFWLQAVEQ